MQAGTILCNISMNVMCIFYFTKIIDSVILQGEKCNKCDATTHVYCLEDYAKNHGGLGCPNCHHPISEYNDSSNFLFFDSLSCLRISLYYSSLFFFTYIQHIVI